MDIPEEIHVSKDILKNKGGRPTTIQKRRKSKPVKGKVKGKRNHFTDEEKLNAVCVFAVSGNSRRTAELTKIPEGTIRGWKATEWWNEAMQRIIVEQDEEIAADMTDLVNKAITAVKDRIDNGDEVYNPKLDKMVKKQVSAKDLAIVAAIAVDKRQLLRGQPTERVEKTTVDDTLGKLAAEFAKFSKAQEVQQVPREPEIIEAEIVEEEEIPQNTINEMFGEADDS